jgi:hypothetical protein
MPGLALDADRLAQLRVFSEAERRQITADVIDAIADQFRRLEAAFAARDLATAADAAHRGRNEALLVGARDLCDALTSVEQAARGGDAGGAENATATARDVWPATKTAIGRAFGHLSEPTT